MLHLNQNNRFKKDFKQMERRGKDMNKLFKVIKLLLKQENQTLIEKFRDHTLKGEYFSFRECHIEPDWLLIYKVKDNKLFLTRTGSHSDLFE